jgi:hypothetical protein
VTSITPLVLLSIIGITALKTRTVCFLASRINISSEQVVYQLKKIKTLEKALRLLLKPQTKGQWVFPVVTSIAPGPTGVLGVKQHFYAPLYPIFVSCCPFAICNVYS